MCVTRIFFLIHAQTALGKMSLFSPLFVYLFGVYVLSGDNCLPCAGSSCGAQITLNDRLVPQQTGVAAAPSLVTPLIFTVIPMTGLSVAACWGEGGGVGPSVVGGIDIKKTPGSRKEHMRRV